MTKYVLSQDAQIEINGTPITDFGSEDIMVITYPNDSIEMRKSKNSASVAKNTQGDIADVELTVVRGSESDVFLNTLLKNQNLNFNSTLTCTAAKTFASDSGDVLQQKHNLNVGMFSKVLPDETISSNASIESVEATYSIRFLDASSKDFV